MLYGGGFLHEWVQLLPSLMLQALPHLQKFGSCTDKTQE